MTLRVLVVTAVAAEAEAVADGLTGRAAGSARSLPSGHTVTSHLLTAAPAAGVPAPAAAAPARAAGVPAAAAPAAAGGGPADRSVTYDGPAAAGPPAATVDVLAAGVGPAAAAVATATALATAPYPYDLVVCAGIGGGFAPHAPLGALVVADAVVAADLGADTPDGYLPVEELGFGRSVHVPPPALTARVADALRAGGRPCLTAPVLTVSTVTGTAARAAELTARHPRAAAEAMEGFGVAEAAAAHGVPVVEVRAVSNTVGPRDRAAWRIGAALDALRGAAGSLSSTVFREE
ncbi:futalosine hydrolase [Streptomyces sp. DH12]|uniref:futalosine hydrolase n=1 Tax=Streptomyces sp. DH12 TaxID=2857010 RepID=UPI001E2F201D|nr:futalosine hydrolase [Streptomyces sp. DH12]